MVPFIDDNNLKEWFENGAYAAGFSGYLTKGIDKTNIDELRRRCLKLIKANR